MAIMVALKTAVKRTIKSAAKNEVEIGRNNIEIAFDLVMLFITNKSEKIIST